MIVFPISYAKCVCITIDQQEALVELSFHKTGIWLLISSVKKSIVYNVLHVAYGQVVQRSLSIFIDYVSIIGELRGFPTQCRSSRNDSV